MKILPQHSDYNERCVCKICYKVYEGLAHHVRLAHGYKVSEYKDIFGIMRTTPLFSIEVSKKFSKNAANMVKEGILRPDIEALRKKRVGVKPVVTTATRKFRASVGFPQIPSEKRSIVSINTYHNKPSTKLKISEALRRHFENKKGKIKCENCGEEKPREPSKINGQNHHFCSRSCFFVWRDANASLP